MDAYNNGLYHFTSNESVDASKMFSSNSITLYGSKKRFFAGIPNFDTMCVNLFTDVKMIALKLKHYYEPLSQFDCRISNDGVVIYKGVFDLKNIPVEKVRLAMKKMVS